MIHGSIGLSGLALGPFVLAALLGAITPVFAPAEELTFTVGIDTTCPYGLEGCWPEVREPITKLAGVAAVSKRINLRTLTCEVQMQDGLMLSSAILRENLRKGVGNAFTVRGIEATLNGLLVSDASEPALQLCGTTNIVRLAPLRQKVQTDNNQIIQCPTDDELTAYGRLLAQSNGQCSTLRVVGPIVESENGQTILEVREFELVDETASAERNNRELSSR